MPDLCARFGLGEQAAALARPEQDGPTFVDALIGAEEYPAALAFLAYVLPRREAVWWAWTCARRSLPADPAPAIQAALDATERWIVQPTDANRRAAFALAEPDLGSPAACAALAVYFTGGSIAPPGAPEVAPPEGAAARAIAGSITLAAVSPPPDKAPERFQVFIRQGLEVATRINLWDSI